MLRSKLYTFVCLSWVDTLKTIAANQNRFLGESKAMKSILFYLLFFTSVTALVVHFSEIKNNKTIDVKLLNAYTNSESVKNLDLISVHS